VGSVAQGFDAIPSENIFTSHGCLESGRSVSGSIHCEPIFVTLFSLLENIALHIEGINGPPLEDLESEYQAFQLLLSIPNHSQGSDSPPGTPPPSQPDKADEIPIKLLELARLVGQVRRPFHGRSVVLVHTCRIAHNHSLNVPHEEEDTYELIAL
jgi:hypothetical protein